MMTCAICRVSNCRHIRAMNAASKRVENGPLMLMRDLGEVLLGALLVVAVVVILWHLPAWLSQ